MAHVEITGLNGQKLLIAARGVTRVRPGLAQFGMSGTTRIDLGSASYHTRTSLPDIVSDLRAGGATLIELIDAAGSRFFASAGAILSVENATDDDPVEAESALWIGGDRQTVRHTFEDLKNLLHNIS